jgi:tetratricopeptide (TPR) repeat protein
MLRKVAAAWFLAVLWGSVPLGAQDSTAVVDRDVRLFAISAALNVAGFDVDLGPRYHPVRQLLRENLSGVDPVLVRRLRGFYQARRGDAPDADQLAAYVSLALGLTPPPGLAPASAPELVPLDAREVSGILPLARELYRTAGLDQMWAVLGPTYDAALDRIAPPIRDALVGVEAYLRLPSGASAGRRAVVLLELSLPRNSVNVRNYPDNLYIVLGDSEAVPVDDVRHGYLHLLLDPVLATYRDRDLLRASELLGLVDGVEGVRPDYAADFETMAGESLIRAVELRIDSGVGTGVEDAVSDLDAAYREGLLLAPFFFEQMAAFERGDVSIRQQMSRIMEEIDVEAEQARFGDRFFAIVPPEPVDVRAEVPPARVVDPARPILEEAQTAFNSGDNGTARALFARVLAEVDPENGSALYGLALIASREQDPPLAREYFSRAILSGSAEPAMVVWSQIYLGRIEDISCNRDAALGHYRAALETGDDTRGALAAAGQGLRAPYGDNC